MDAVNKEDVMKPIRFTIYCVLLTLLYSTSLASQQGFHSVPTRDNVQQPLWLIEPGNATHILILFAGGKGKLNIDEDGIGDEGNFLVRTRNQFAKQGMVVAVVDTPSDRKNMTGFRTTGKYAEDIKAVMEFLRKSHPNKPLWLVGTSRGTISAANIAERVQGESGPDGIILTSSVTRKSKKNLDSLDDVDLSSITVPTYVVHHKKDGCMVTPYDEAEALINALSSVKVKEFKGFSGGQTKGNPCEGKSYHGFLGIENKVVKSITDWVKAR